MLLTASRNSPIPSLCVLLAHHAGSIVASARYSLRSHQHSSSFLSSSLSSVAMSCFIAVASSIGLKHCAYLILACDGRARADKTSKGRISIGRVGCREAFLAAGLPHFRTNPSLSAPYWFQPVRLYVGKVHTRR